MESGNCRVRITARYYLDHRPWGHTVAFCFREVLDAVAAGPAVYVSARAKVVEARLPVTNSGVFCVDVYICGVRNGWPGVNHVSRGYWASDGISSSLPGISIPLSITPVSPSGKRTERARTRIAQVIAYEEGLSAFRERARGALEREVSQMRPSRALSGEKDMAYRCHISTALGPEPSLPSAFFFGKIEEVSPPAIWAFLEKCATAVTETMLDDLGNPWTATESDADYHWLSRLVCAYSHAISYISDITEGMHDRNDIFEMSCVNRSGDCEDMSAMTCAAMMALIGPAPPTLSPALERIRRIALNYKPYVALLTVNGEESRSMAHLVAILVRVSDDRKLPPTLLAEATNMHASIDVNIALKQTAVEKSSFIRDYMSLVKVAHGPEQFLSELCRLKSEMFHGPKLVTHGRSAAGEQWYHNMVELYGEEGQFIATDKDGGMGVAFVDFMNDPSPRDLITRFKKRTSLSTEGFRLSPISHHPTTAEAPWIVDFSGVTGISEAQSACEKFLSSLSVKPLARKGFATFTIGYWCLCANLAAVQGTLARLGQKVWVKVHDVDMHSGGDTVRRVSFMCSMDGGLSEESIKGAQNSEARRLEQITPGMATLPTFAPQERLEITRDGVGGVLPFMGSAVPAVPAVGSTLSRLAKKRAEQRQAATETPMAAEVAEEEEKEISARVSDPPTLRAPERSVEVAVAPKKPRKRPTVVADYSQSLANRARILTNMYDPQNTDQMAALVHGGSPYLHIVKEIADDPKASSAIAVLSDFVTKSEQAAAFFPNSCLAHVVGRFALKTVATFNHATLMGPGRVLVEIGRISESEHADYARRLRNIFDPEGQRVYEKAKRRRARERKHAEKRNAEELALALAPRPPPNQGLRDAVLRMEERGYTSVLPFLTSAWLRTEDHSRGINFACQFYSVATREDLGVTAVAQRIAKKSKNDGDFLDHLFAFVFIHVLRKKPILGLVQDRMWYYDHLRVLRILLLPHPPTGLDTLIKYASDILFREQMTDSDTTEAQHLVDTVVGRLKRHEELEEETLFALAAGISADPRIVYTILDTIREEYTKGDLDEPVLFGIQTVFQNLVEKDEVVQLQFIRETTLLRAKREVSFATQEPTTTQEPADAVKALTDHQFDPKNPQGALPAQTFYERVSDLVGKMPDALKKAWEYIVMKAREARAFISKLAKDVSASARALYERIKNSKFGQWVQELFAKYWPMVQEALIKVKEFAAHVLEEIKQLGRDVLMLVAEYRTLMLTWQKGDNLGII